jgi:hypothetical protein
MIEYLLFSYLSNGPKSKKPLIEWISTCWNIQLFVAGFSIFFHSIMTRNVLYLEIPKISFNFSVRLSLVNHNLVYILLCWWKGGSVTTATLFTSLLSSILDLKLVNSLYSRVSWHFWQSPCSAQLSSATHIEVGNNGVIKKTWKIIEVKCWPH